MNAVAVLLRLFSLFGLVGLALFLWLEHESYIAQDEAFLEEQVENGYEVLQSSKETQWKNVKDKKQAFMDVFDANEPVSSVNDPNPLTEAANELKAAEDAVLKKREYTAKLDAVTREFGQGSFIWNSEAKSWDVADPKKSPVLKAEPESIGNLKNNFADIDLYKENQTDENGNFIPGVSHHNRLRTLLGKFYKARKDTLSELYSSRQMTADRDRALRESQRLYDNMKEEKEKWEASSRDFELKFQSSQADLANEKEERQQEKEAFETEVKGLKDLTAQLEKEKQDLDQQRLAQIDELKAQHGTKVNELTREIQIAEKRGYQTGIDYMMKQQTGANVAGDANKTDNVFAGIGEDLNAPPPPSGPVGAVTTLEEVSKYGLATSIARIDKSSGMLMLPVGSEKGIARGGIWTIYKAQEATARIKVQSSANSYSLAYILPRFGNPSRLRPGDVIQIVPQTNKTL
ncbi:MAG: hypothetical protein HN627_12115 [Opitutae bacterium]|nr:hypothetical protein [Opitutae bacterium]MBT7924993.1 hypothetical protein [Opitutae bacterium]